MSEATYEQWRSGVLGGIQAPTTAQNEALLDGWAEAETSPYPLMRWNNPLNCTEKMPGSRDSGAQPGADDVQVYATVNDGISATVQTLLNGRYPAIVAGLRGSEPPAWYQSHAAAEFATWGTGAGFLAHVPTIPAPVPPAPPTTSGVPRMFIYQRINGSIFLCNMTTNTEFGDGADVTYFETLGYKIAYENKLTPVFAAKLNALPVK